MPRILPFASGALAILVLRAQPPAPPAPPDMSTPAGSAKVEQRVPGNRPPLPVLVSFDGLGAGFEGPQGPAAGRNPSDNSLAVGADRIVQTVNTRLAVFDKTGKVLYGAVPTNSVFKGFGGVCEAATERRCGGALRSARRPLAAGDADLPAHCRPARGALQRVLRRQPEARPARRLAPLRVRRKLFPDYPRPAVWPDGYYTPTSTGDDVIQKHVCIADRAKMLKGEPATEQCIVIDGVNFLNNADIDGDGAAARRRAQHHDGRRRRPTEEGPRGRRHLLLEGPRGLGRPEHRPATGARERSTWRPTTIFAAAN